MFPHRWITDKKQFLHMTHKGERSYSHIAFARLDDGLAFNLPRKKEKILLAKYQYSLVGITSKKAAK